MSKLSYAAVTKLLNDCEETGGDLSEVGPLQFEFHAEQGAILRVKFTNGKPSSLLLIGTAAGTAISPPIKVTVTQARALSELH
jgi:hypothetical protein